MWDRDVDWDDTELIELLLEGVGWNVSNLLSFVSSALTVESKRKPSRVSTDWDNLISDGLMPFLVSIMWLL